MNPVEIPESIPGYEPITYAKDQPEYIPLPAVRQSISEHPTPEELASWHGAVISRWRPSTAELEKLLAGDDICLEVWTFGNVCGKCGAAQGLQPVMIGVWSDRIACVDGSTNGEDISGGRSDAEPGRDRKTDPHA